MTSNQKWYDTTWKLAILISVMILGLFSLVSIFDYYSSNVEMRNRTISARVRFGLGWDGKIPDSSRALLYDSIENSVQAYAEDMWLENTIVSDEILRFEAEGYLMSIFSGESATYSLYIPFTSQVPNIDLFLLETDGEKYSSPQYAWANDIETMPNNYGVCYDEDRVARDVIISHFRGDITSIVNNEKTLFYGVGMGSIPERMTILGYEPDNIVSFTYKTEDYYLWYYYDMSIISDILINNIDFDAFTFAEMIELLEIVVLTEG